MIRLSARNDRNCSSVYIYSVLNVSHSSYTREVKRVGNYYSVLRLIVLMATTVFVPPISILPEYTFPNAPVERTSLNSENALLKWKEEHRGNALQWNL